MCANAQLLNFYFTNNTTNTINFTGSQFHQHFMLAFFVRKFVQSQTLSREKLLNWLLYEKCARKMLMKLGSELLTRSYAKFVHFTHFAACQLVQRKSTDAKAARKRMMKLTLVSM
jgi:hypothetical protein